MFHPTRIDRVDTPLEELTECDREVLVLIAEGLTVKQMAGRLGLSPKSVESRKYRLMRKVQLHDRVHLCRYAIRQGLIEP